MWRISCNRACQTIAERVTNEMKGSNLQCIKLCERVGCEIMQRR